MKHRKKGRKLKRTASHRKALLSNLAIALIKHKRIKTTIAKAKELRTYIEPYVTKAKNALKFKSKEAGKALHLRRVTASMIKDKEAIQILFDEIAKKVENRNGGYTRILKTGFRYGDGANEAIIEFVDYSIIKEKEKAEKKKEEIKGKGKDKKEDTTEAPVEEPKKETKVKKAAKPKTKKTTAKEKEEKPKAKTVKAKKETAAKPKRTRKQDK